jgi:biopolymer transport protein ExbD
MPIGAAEAAQQEKLALQMTPMIDVVFQLLIFFIVTLNIPKEEAMIETELPRARGAGEVTGQEPQTREEFEDILLSIVKEPVTGQARIYVNNQWMMNSRQLLGRLEMFRNLNEKGRVVVQCGDNVPYKDLIEAISIVQIAELPMAFANLK